MKITGPAQNLTNTWDFQAAVDYQNGSGSSPIVNYQLVGDNGVVENGQLSGTSGMVAGGNGAHYGTGLTLSITSICETYPDGSQLCSPQNYSTRMGVAVSTAIGGPRYDATTSTFSWTSWPTGSGYTLVTYSCGNGPEAPMPPVGQTATCQAPPGAANPSLTVTVRVGSATYATSYPASGMQ